jgi:hypothetical protein
MSPSPRRLSEGEHTASWSLFMFLILILIILIIVIADGDRQCRMESGYVHGDLGIQNSR